MATLKAALQVAESTRNAFNYWLSADLLSTDFSKTTPGVARSLSRENVLEIAYMAALTDIGESPRDAQGTIRMLLKQDRSGETYRFLLKRNDAAYWLHSDDVSVGQLPKTLGAPRIIMPGIETREHSVPAAISYSIIDVGEIRRRVDKLFADANEG